MTGRVNPSCRSLASLSLDLDNQWSYMKTHGDDGWTTYPSYLGWAVPRILEYLANRDLKITFFVVGADAAQECNVEALGSISAAGHEIGNHSFQHEPWLHLYSLDELQNELRSAEDAIEQATGRRPVGFRGPGFSLSPNTLRVLSDRGYEYDATVFPNLLNPLARAYFFATSNLSPEEREQRKGLFGTWRDALRPVKPFRWKLEDSEMLEMPVTTMPLFKVPIHLSYILYASRFSRSLAKLYFRMAIALCRRTNVAPSILLHPLDFIGKGEVPELEFFPGMDIELEKKMEIVDFVLDLLGANFDLVTLGEHAASAGSNLKSLELQPGT